MNDQATGTVDETSMNGSETIENRIAKAMRAKRSPKMPEGMTRELEDDDGYEILGDAPMSVRHLRCLLAELMEEHSGLKRADRKARGTPEAGAATAAHMQNHEDALAVRAKLLEELNAAFEVDGRNYSGYKILDDWKVAGKPQSEDDGEDFLSALRRAAEEAIPEHLRGKVKVEVGKGFPSDLLMSILGGKARNAEGDALFDDLFGGGLGDAISKALGGFGDDAHEKAMEDADDDVPDFLKDFRRNGNSFFPDVFKELFGDKGDSSAKSDEDMLSFEEWMRAQGRDDILEMGKKLGLLGEDGEPDLAKLFGRTLRGQRANANKKRDRNEYSSGAVHDQSTTIGDVKFEIGFTININLGGGTPTSEKPES